MRTKYKEKKPTGRPTNYKPEYDDIAYKMCSKGAVLVDLAEEFGCSHDSVLRWMTKNESFGNAVKIGTWKWQSEQVVAALYKRATGHTYDEVKREFILIDGAKYVEKTEKVQQGKHKNGKPIMKAVKILVHGEKITITRKEIQPSDLATMYWLQNREEQDWKNVQKSEVISTNTHTHKHEHDLSNLETEEIKHMRELVAKAKQPESKDALALTGSN